MTKAIQLALPATTLALPALAETPVLIALTYDNFTAERGLGLPS